MTPIQQELEQIRESNGGTIPPEAVVEFARNPETALHERFDWDDSEAAHMWRLEQARRIIRVQVTFEPRTETKVPIYVNLHSDRHDGTGYRAVADVMNDEEKRQLLLRDLMRDLEAWQRRAQRFRELVPIFDAAERVRRKIAKQAKQQPQPTP